MRQSIFKSTRFFAGGIYAGLAALAIFIATPSAATVVFEQPPLDGADSFASFFDEQSADDFILANNTSITAVRCENRSMTARSTPAISHPWGVRSTS